MSSPSIPLVSPPLTETRPGWLTRELFPFRSRFLEIDGCRIHYVDEGSGPVLLMLHAAPASSFIYREFLGRLKDRFRCLALDYPGFGLSEPRPDYRFTLPQLSETVRNFVQALDLTGVTLFVHDSSGPIGLGAAVQDPGRYGAVILTDTLAFPLDAYPLIRAMLRLVTSRPFRAANRSFNLLAWMVSTLAPVRRRLSGAERRVYRRLFPTAAARDRILDLFQELLGQREFLAQVEARLRQVGREWPALILYGQFDPTRLMGWDQRMATIFPRHVRRVIPWEGHFPHEGSPDRMIAEIESWAAMRWGAV